MATTRTVSLKPAPVVTTKATVEATTEIKLANKVKAKLLGLLMQYGSVSIEIKELTATKNDIKASISKIRQDAGVTSFDVDGYKITEVSSTRFDKDATMKKIMAMYGLTIDQIKAAEVYKTTKAFEKITVPGVGDDE